MKTLRGTEFVVLPFVVPLVRPDGSGLMLNCADPEGWGPTSGTRWDFTPCFEEGVVLPIVHLLFILAATWSLWVLARTTPLERTAHSQKLLVVKLVCCLNFFGAVWRI